jgi:hypothetical protein
MNGAFPYGLLLAPARESEFLSARGPGHSCVSRVDEVV